MECLLPFGPESYVLQFAVKKYEALIFITI